MFDARFKLTMDFAAGAPPLAYCSTHSETCSQLNFDAIADLKIKKTIKI